MRTSVLLLAVLIHVWHAKCDKIKLPTADMSKNSASFVPIKANGNLTWPETCGKHKIYSQTRDNVNTEIKIDCIPGLNDVLVGGDLSGGVKETMYCARVGSCTNAANSTECNNVKLYDYRVQPAESISNTAASLFVSSPGCRHWSKKANNMRHRFQNEPKPLVESKTKNGLKSDGKDLFVSTPPYYRKDIDSHVQKAPLFESPFNGFKFENNKTCNSSCEYGKMIQYNINIGATFDVSLTLDNKCEWVHVCTMVQPGPSANTISCDPFFIIYIQLQNGFVVSGKTKKGVIMNMKHENAMRVDVSRTKPDGKIMVTSGFRERAIFAENTAHRLAFAFSHSDCLLDQFGIKGELPNGFHLMTASEHDPKPADSVNNYQAPEVVTVPAPVINTTKNPQDVPLPSTTVKPSIYSQGNLQKSGQMLPGSAASQGNKPHGWLTWACFYGFLTGSSVGVLLMGAVFYLCRRTVFGNWYRGMYKRYHCDASGTTGGVTGSAFGDTTQGGTNVSQMSTVAGGTTAGTTGTSGGTTDGTNTSAMSSADTGTKTDMVTM